MTAIATTATKITAWFDLSGIVAVGGEPVRVLAIRRKPFADQSCPYRHFYRASRCECWIGADQPGEPKEIKRLFDFSTGALEAFFSRCFFKRYTFRFWFSTETLGTEPNRMPKIMCRGGRQSERPRVSHLFDCAFISPPRFRSPSRKRISLILWLQPRSSRRDDLRPQDTTFWKHGNRLLLRAVNPLPGKR
jgi:hypothetical protein